MSWNDENTVTYDIDETANHPVVSDIDEIIEMGEDFDFEGFQVVRREFFAHLREPSVSFSNCKISVNTACLTRFPSTNYAQILINRNNKILALRPCPDGARDSFRWCNVSPNGKRKPRAITCRLFFAKLVALMDWNPDHRYKLLGNLVHSNDEYLLAFDLTATEVYQRTESQEGKPKTSRIPVFPIEWKDQFGLPYLEHKNSMRINVVDGYAVYSIRDKSADKNEQGEQMSLMQSAVDPILDNANGGTGI